MLERRHFLGGAVGVSRRRREPCVAWPASIARPLTLTDGNMYASLVYGHAPRWVVVAEKKSIEAREVRGKMKHGQEDVAGDDGR